MPEPESEDTWLDWATKARNAILLAILVVQALIGGALWLTRDRTVQNLRENQSKILRILRQDFREECVENNNPVHQCEERLREDDRYWPSSSILYRAETYRSGAPVVTLYPDERSG